MPCKRFTALVTAASILASCTAPPATVPSPTSSSPPSAQLGTVAPAYPVGTDLAPGIEVIEAIPVTELSTAKPFPLAGTDACTSIPAKVVNPAGTVTPVSSDEFGCVWQGPDLGLDIGAEPEPMAKEVEAHVAMANGGSDPLAHLTWLRVDGHYAIERILEFDPAKSCRLTLDVSSPATFHVMLYPIDPASGEPTKSDTRTSVRDVCPAARQIAKNLLNHIEDQRPGWWETVIHPTE